MNDVVTEGGSTYVALVTNSEIDPATNSAAGTNGVGTVWALMAQLGATARPGLPEWLTERRDRRNRTERCRRSEGAAGATGATGATASTGGCSPWSSGTTSIT